MARLCTMATAWQRWQRKSMMANVHNEHKHKHKHEHKDSMVKTSSTLKDIRDIKKKTRPK